MSDTKEIIEALKLFETQFEDGFVGIFPEKAFLVFNEIAGSYEYQDNVILDQHGTLEIESVKEGEGHGSKVYIVLKLTQDDGSILYFKKDGYYYSYHGYDDWSDWFEVKLVTRKVIFYEKFETVEEILSFLNAPSYNSVFNMDRIFYAYLGTPLDPCDFINHNVFIFSDCEYCDRETFTKLKEIKDQILEESKLLTTDLGSELAEHVYTRLSFLNKKHRELLSSAIKNFWDSTGLGDLEVKFKSAGELYVEDYPASIIVIYFPKFDLFLRRDGEESSYSSISWGSWYEVAPVEKTVITYEYEPIKNN